MKNKMIFKIIVALVFIYLLIGVFFAIKYANSYDKKINSFPKNTTTFVINVLIWPLNIGSDNSTEYIRTLDVGYVFMNANIDFDSNQIIYDSQEGGNMTLVIPITQDSDDAYSYAHGIVKFKTDITVPGSVPEKIGDILIYRAGEISIGDGQLSFEYPSGTANISDQKIKGNIIDKSVSGGGIYNYRVEINSPDLIVADKDSVSTPKELQGFETFTFSTEKRHDENVVNKDDNPDTSDDSRDYETQMFQNEFVSFEYPFHWLIDIEEDKEYGYVYYRRTEDESGETLQDFSFMRSLYDRDSIKSPESYLLLESEMLAGAEFEEMQINNKLENVGHKATVDFEVEGTKFKADFFVAHFKLEEPINEYFDAVTVSGYYVSEIQGQEVEDHVGEIKKILETVSGKKI